MKGLWKKCRKALGRLYMKAVTDKGTPEYIARGWGIGMFIGLAIPFGAQLIFSIPMSFLMKGSKLGAILGTLVTNHITIIVIYPVQCWIGNKLIGGSLSLEYLREKMMDVIVRQEYKVLIALGREIVISFFAGGLLFAVIATPVCYYAVKAMVIRYRALREKRRLAKQQKLAAKQTEKEK